MRDGRLGRNIQGAKRSGLIRVRLHASSSVKRCIGILDFVF